MRILISNDDGIYSPGIVPLAKAAARLGEVHIVAPRFMPDRTRCTYPSGACPVFTVTPLQGAVQGTDRWAVEQNWVSITPLRLALTDETDLARALARSHTPATKLASKPSRKKR